MKNRTCIIVFASAIVLCVALCIVISSFFDNSKTVVITQDGKVVEKIDLNMVTSDKEIVLKGEYGDNVILVSHGKIKMLSADCPDKVCVNHGELQSGGNPIVCLPNKVVIRWEMSSDEFDVKSGAYNEN